MEGGVSGVRVGLVGGGRGFEGFVVGGEEAGKGAGGDAVVLGDFVAGGAGGEEVDDGVVVVVEDVGFGGVAEGTAEVFAGGTAGGKGFAGAGGDEVALDFGHEAEGEAEDFAVEVVLEGVAFFGGVEDDAPLDAGVDDVHDVEEGAAEAGYLGDDEGVAPVEGVEEVAEGALVAGNGAAYHVVVPVVDVDVTCPGEFADFGFLVDEVLFGGADA